MCFKYGCKFGSSVELKFPATHVSVPIFFLVGGLSKTLISFDVDGCKIDT